MQFVVPEGEERTAEGGLDIISEEEKLKSFLRPLAEKKFAYLYLFLLNLNKLKQLQVGATIVELNTGTFCDLLMRKEKYLVEFEKLTKTQILAIVRLRDTWRSWSNLRKCKIHSIHPEMKELNIGHFLISEAVFNGIEKQFTKCAK